MKRIALLIESLESGGAQRQLVGLAKLLHADGYDVKLFCYYQRDFYTSELEKNGIPVEVVRDDKRHITRIPRIAAALNRYNPDVVISYLDTPSIMACLIKKMTFAKWRLIVSERNTTQNLSRKERLKFSLYRFADAIVPNSETQGAFIKEHYPNLAAKVRVITNFVDTDYFSPAPAQLQPDNNELRMVCVGRIVPQKNLIRFLEALAKVSRECPNRLRVDWFGDKYDAEYYQRCQAIIESESLQDIFEFHAPSQHIRDRYRASDIFCLPSIYEGFPNVLCEAMSCGLPVVCGNVCDNASIAVEGRSGYLFDPHSVDSIADALTRILSLPDDSRRQMGEFNRQLAIDSFSQQAFLNKYLSLITPQTIIGI